MEDKMIVKFDGGNLAMLCSGCHKTLKRGFEFTSKELDYAFGNKSIEMPSRYCEQCKKENNDSKQNENNQG